MELIFPYSYFNLSYSFFNNTIPFINKSPDASLEWNSIEQLFFWQLINAHEIPTSRFLPLIHSVDSFSKFIVKLMRLCVSDIFTDFILAHVKCIK